MKLNKGEFLGRTTDEAQPFLLGLFQEKFYQLEPFVKLKGVNDWQLVVENNSRRIRKEVGEVVRGEG